MRAPQCMQNGVFPLVAWPQPGQATTAGAAAACPVTCAPHIEQNGVLALTAEPQLGQLAGALAGAACAAAAVKGVPQCMQKGEFPFTSPPQCEQRETPGEVAPCGAEVDEYCV
jgi:hypothetical protein